MTRGPWTDAQGWPVPYPPALAVAIRAIPGCTLSDAGIASLAHRLAAAESDGWEAAAPHMRSKSFAQNEAALRAMHDQCARLGQLIGDLPREAFQALAAEGFDVSGLRERLAEAEEVARHAFSGMTGPDVVGGRPIDVRARMVADEAAEVFNTVSNATPTYTTDPLSEAVPRRLGPWPEFLAQVFAALMVNASTDSHVERISRNK